MCDPSGTETRKAPARASVVDLTFALWALLIPLLFHHHLLNGDGDLARHLVIGGHILQEGPRFDDVFSFTRAGEPFLAYEWLSQVFFHLVYRVGGLPLVAVSAGLILGGAAALVVAYVRQEGEDPWLAFMTGTLAMILTSPHWIARPHLFTILALPCLLLLLNAKRMRLPGIAALFAVWANLHPGFLYGLVILFVISAGKLVEKGLRGPIGNSEYWETFGPVGLAGAASLMNPFGWSLHVHAVTHAANSEFLQTITEFQPLDLFTAYGFLIMGALVGVALGLSAQSKRVPLDAMGAFFLGFFATLIARRNGPLLAVAGLPMMAACLSPVVSRLPNWLAGRMRRVFRESDHPSRKAGIGALAVLILTISLGGRVGPVTLIPGRFSEEAFPVEAVERAREAGLSGRLLSEYHWGGYVLLNWPGQRIFVDSMADFFGPELLYQYIAMHDAAPAWRKLLQSHEISLVLLTPSAPLTKELREDPDWEVWHEDASAVVFVRELEQDQETML